MNSSHRRSQITSSSLPAFQNYFARFVCHGFLDQAFPYPNTYKKVAAGTLRVQKQLKTNILLSQRGEMIPFVESRDSRMCFSERL